MIGITILGIAIITIKNMDTFSRIALGHISELTIKDGWMKLYALVLIRLVM